MTAKSKPSSASRLVFVTDAEPGITRHRRGTGFQYHDAKGRRIRNPRELKRIAALAIPPAYQDVWICRHGRGHLQATGRDARGRKQYRYHANWRVARDRRKFDRMTDFGAALPKLRQQLKRDLALQGLPREKVLAAMASLLDITRVRIGNSEYARDNGSYGLATLRDRHARFIRTGRVLLDFRGKGGKQHEIRVENPQLARIMRRCQELPGQHLFQYLDDHGKRHAINSQDVNDYLRDAMGVDVTSKDFRTWGATVKAITLLARMEVPKPPSERSCKRLITGIVEQVAEELRNTPAVCRKSYISPIVFEWWRAGTLHRELTSRIAGKTSARIDRLALSFMRRHPGRAKKPG